ncbi:MAG: DNA translocase FtsK [Clostridia bacterium]|nr:DNA translocase FtsK [Clostridia bacterium]MBR6787532.1 DNA translocase FtsK [Clostridia bacterium]
MAQSKKAQITTTARGGPVRMALGCMLIALGCGWGIALLANTSSAFVSLQLLRDTAHGLAGSLCTLLPVFTIWGGVQLCVSARRRASVRAYFIALIMYVILLAILTLWSSIGDQTLMTYIANCNKTWLGLQDHTSFGAYLTGAYNLRAFNGGMLAGGGLIGMLLAFPLYCTYFGTAGSAFILCAVELLLLLWLFRLNPFEMWRTVNVRREEKMQNQPEADAEEYAPQMEPQRRQVAMEPLIPQQQVTYSRGTSVQSDVEESYLVPEQQQYEEYQQPTPQDRGFVPVETGVLYEEHIPVGDDYKPVQEPKKRTSTRRAARHEQPSVQPAAPVQEKQEETVPWYSDEELKAQKQKPYEAPQMEQQSFEAPVQPVMPEKKAPSVRAGSHVTGEIKQVYTDPAVDLGSKRIPINPRSEEAPREDPFAVKHTKEAMRAVSGEYSVPPLMLLKDPQRQLVDTTAEDNERAALLEHTLSSFNIDAKVSYVVHGPAITRFALKLADGVNVNRLNNISNNLAMTMQAVGLRIEIPIPGTSLVGIEVPNKKVSMVTFKEVLDSPAMRQNPSPTAVAMGKDITGTPIICDLSDMPHLLIAGATGSGKSVCINSIIMSILYRATPQQVRMLMIDPKLVELQPYNGIPHLLTEVVSDPKKAAAALDWVVQEMGDRYRRFQQTGVRNIAGYNGKMKNEADKMPDIVVIIDEFSDLMVQCRKQVEESIQRLAALARAAGIYMIVATQRPSVDVITGVIKANIPSRIAFAVANNVDSRTIIDSNGAEKLLGKGDMLYFPRSEFRPIRVQGCFVSDNEVSAITDYIKDNNDATYDSRVDEHMERAAREEAEANAAANHPNDPEYQVNTENELLQRAIEMAVESGQMSISMLRRRLGLGHSRAGKLIDTMANMGIVSQDEGPKPRRTLITREDYIKMQGQILDE